MAAAADFQRCAIDVLQCLFHQEHDIDAFATAAVTVSLLFLPDEDGVGMGGYLAPSSVQSFLADTAVLPIPAVNHFRTWMSNTLGVSWAARWSLRKMLLCGAAACHARHGAAAAEVGKPDYFADARSCLVQWMKSISTEKCLCSTVGCARVRACLPWLRRLAAALPQRSRLVADGRCSVRRPAPRQLQLVDVVAQTCASR